MNAQRSTLNAQRSRPETDAPTRGDEALIARALEQLRVELEMRRKAAAEAGPALQRLCRAMAMRSGQGYKVRALLYSLWNGKPASLLDVVALDWPLRMDLAAVCLGFGFRGTPEFFYDAIQTEVKWVGCWEWFLEEGKR